MTTVLHGTNVSISTRTVPDNRRWEEMPSLLSLKNNSNTLIVLDLHKSRYMTKLHDSVCDMGSLKKLVLTHCHKLTTLPDNIGKLTLLEEVSSRSASSLLRCVSPTFSASRYLASSLNHFFNCLSPTNAPPYLRLAGSFGFSSYRESTRLNW